MREVVLGTAGHVDHGKTTFVKALTGIDTDRLKEEKERGITIELGFAHLDLPCGHRVGIVDVPGHERFVRNMVAGASGIDLVAFIIAADEGIMPQTREHFEICRLLGVSRGLVVITKKDMVDEEWLELVQEDVRAFFAGSFLEDAPVVAVSAVTGEGMDQALEVIDRLVAASDFAEAYGPFRMPVDRVFTMKGFGVVVTGTSIAGRIKVGDDVLFYPGGRGGKVRGIQVHGQDRQEVEAGYRTAINVQGVERLDISRGDVLATPGCLVPATVFDAELQYLSSNERPLKNRARVRVHVGTAEIMGRVVLLNQDEVSPGEVADVQLQLEEPASVWPGDRFVIRSYSPVTTLGGGVIWNCSPPKRKRYREANREIFETYHRGEAVELALLHLTEASFAGLTLDTLGVKLGIFGNRLKKILEKPISARKIVVVDSDRQRLVAASVYDRFVQRAKELLEGFHAANPLLPGLAAEELRQKLDRRLDPRFFNHLMGELVGSQAVVQEGSLVRLATHEVRLAADAEKLKKEISSLYRDAGLKVPTVKETLARFADVPSGEVREVLDLMLREGDLVRVTEELYYPAETLDGLMGKVREFLAREGEIDAPRFKELTGLTRKFTIPLLEYMDRIKLTIRVGDKRILRGGS